jgi:hypothetical protein
MQAMSHPNFQKVVISDHCHPPSICGRHAHNVAFQKSDLFFVCVLRPLSNDIKIDETEIQAAKVRCSALARQARRHMIF